MKVDLYAKVILTIIAGCLVFMVVRDIPIVHDAYAQSRSIVEVNIVQIDGKPFASFDVSSYNPALPVKVVK